MNNEIIDEEIVKTNDKSSFVTLQNDEIFQENIDQNGADGSKNDITSQDQNNKDDNINQDDEIEDVKLSEEIVNEKLKNVIESQSPKKRKKATILSILLLLLNIVFMIFIVKNLIVDVGDFNFKSLVHTQGSKLLWLCGGLGVYALFIFVQVVAFRVLLKNLTGKTSWRVAYDVAIVGKYYDNVTPFAVGGQPMQILTLSKNKIGAGVATGIPLIKMIINTAMSALIALIFFIVGLPLLSASSPLNQFLLLIIEILGVIGLIITILLAVFMLLISSGTLFTRSFISGILRFLYKIKLVKNYRQTYRKVLNQVAEYKFSLKYLLKNKKLLFLLIFLNIIEYLCISLFPFFVMLALIPSQDINIFLLCLTCMTKYNLCQMASCYIPLPGGTGLMEISFIILFGIELNSNIIWGLLGWRFLSYYLIIIHGFIHELAKIISGFIKNKKQVKLAKTEN